MNKNLYRRPKKPKVIPVNKRLVDNLKPWIEIEKPLIVDASSECHVTPPDVAERMAEYLGPVKNLLEPSAGTGNLLMAARATNKMAIERSQTLCGAIRKRTGINPLCKDFLDHNEPGAYDGIIMNPPFSRVEAHIKKALECTSTGGTIIALVPSTFKNDKYGAETIESLPPETFSSCKVNTKIIMINK